uniref:HintC domain-containing protein n=1 Tax=Angiostrongylus cantonensis TaxID=6313 RepID=A0A158P5X1_ANGCA
MTYTGQESPVIRSNSERKMKTTGKFDRQEIGHNSVEHTCCNLFNPRLPHTIPTHVGNDCFIYELPDGSSHTEPVTFNDQPPLTILKNAAEIPEHIGVSGYRLRLYLLKNKSPPTLLVKGIERRLKGQLSGKRSVGRVGLALRKWSTWARNVWGDAAKSQNRRRVDGVQSKAADPSSSLPSGQGVPNIHVHVNASGNNNNVISGNNGRENTVPGHINITIHTGENRQSIGNGANEGLGSRYVDGSSRRGDGKDSEENGKRKRGRGVKDSNNDDGLVSGTHGYTRGSPKQNRNYERDSADGDREGEEEHEQKRGREGKREKTNHRKNKDGGAINDDDASNADDSRNADGDNDGHHERHGGKESRGMREKNEGERNGRKSSKVGQNIGKSKAGAGNGDKNRTGSNGNEGNQTVGKKSVISGHKEIEEIAKTKKRERNREQSIKDEKNISESEAGTRDGEGSKSGSDGSGRSEAVGKKGKIMRKESGEAGSEAGKESRKNSENPGDFRSGDGNGNSNGDSDGVRGVGSRTFTVRNGDGIDGSGDPRVEAKGGGSSAADVQSGNGGENAVSPTINGAGRAKIGDRAEGVGPKKGENHSGNGAEPSERVKLKNSSISRKEKGKDSLSAEDGMDRNDLLRGGSMRSVSIEQKSNETGGKNSGILDGSDKSKGADGKPRFEGMKGQNGHIGKTLSRQASVTDHPSETIIEQTTKRTIESSKRKSTLLNSKLGVTSTPDMLTTSRSTDAAIVSVEGTTARTSTNRTTKKKSKTTEDDSKVGKLSKEAGKANGGLSPTTSSGLKSGKTVSSKASHSMGGTISNKSTNVYGRNATKPIQESAEMTTLKSKTVSSSVSTNTTLKASLGGGLGASSGNHSSISSALENAKATIKPPSNSSTIPVDKKAASIRVAAPSARARLAAAAAAGQQGEPKPPSKKAADPKAEKAMKRLKRMNCFPADALVTTTTGRKRMDQLAVGDFRSQVADDSSPSVAIHTRFVFDYLYLFCVEKLLVVDQKRALANADGVEQWLRASRFADKVSVGDCVMTVGDNGKMFTERIIKVGRQISEGIYSPMTVTGSLLVDDVLSSCFSQVESHTVQKIVFDFFVYVREAFGFHSEHSVERKGIPPFITYVYELSHIILPFSNF